MSSTIVSSANRPPLHCQDLCPAIRNRVPGLGSDCSGPSLVGGWTTELLTGPDGSVNAEVVDLPGGEHLACRNRALKAVIEEALSSE